MTHILVKTGTNIFGVCVRVCCQKRGLMLEFRKHKDQIRVTLFLQSFDASLCGDLSRSVRDH